ncbi:transposase [Flavobacterium sp. 7A]|uniref:transposase n=1 Tax=Flavobacterium sp. 7A TaxID=2940571 RepID=UPI0039B5FE77
MAQVSDFYKGIYGKEYSKHQISYLMKNSREELTKWLQSKLESHYLVFYINTTFINNRRDKSDSKEDIILF